MPRTEGPLPLAMVTLVMLLLPSFAGADPNQPSGSSSDGHLAAERIAPRGGLWIETITVEGVRHGRSETVLTESLLRPGRAYTEGQLREAADRLRRLPFLLDAEMSLRRGTRRGLHQLVITVSEVERFVYGVDLRHTELGSSLGVDGSREAPLPGLDGFLGGDFGAAGFGSSLTGTDGVTEAAIALGGRWFVGPQSQVFAGWSGEGLEVGWAHHDLGHRGVFASVQLSARDGCCRKRVPPLGLDPGLGVWSLEDTRQARLTVAMPLSARRAVRLTADLLDAGHARREPLLPTAAILGETFAPAGDLERFRLALAWLHDSSDDPFLPSRGTVLRATLAHDSLRGVTTAESSTLSFAATRHLPVTARQTVSLGGRASLGRGDATLAALGDASPGDSTTRSIAVGGRWSYDLRPRTAADWRLELGAGWSREGISLEVLDGSTSGAGAPLEAVEHAQAEVALVYRHAWGVVRLAFAVLDLDEVGR